MTRPARALALFAALALAPVLADARGPSTPAERKKAVETVRRLEAQPLAAGANAERVRLLKWIEAIPDITVRTCSGPLDPLAQDESDEKHGRVLFAQAVFGQAAFLAEHPKKADDWVAVQAAGIESVLRAYKSLLKQDPAARWKELEILGAARAAGKLEELIEETMESCGEAGQQGDAI